jgi:hypothetical protein
MCGSAAERRRRTTPDETFEAVATGQAVVLLAEVNTTVYARPGIVFRPVVDPDPCRLAVAWRRGERRRVVRDFVRAPKRSPRHLTCVPRFERLAGSRPVGLRVRRSRRLYAPSDRR